MSASLLAAQAVDLAASSEVKGGEQVAFWLLAPVAVIGAVGMVLARNAIHSALFLVCTMLSLGVFYVINAGPFIGMVQIIVYTGAVMILFLFVLMLIGRDSSDSIVEILRGQRLFAALLGIGLAGLVVSGLTRAFADVQAKGITGAEVDGNVPKLAEVLFTKYVFAFEVTSALLITAAIGAVMLTFIQKAPNQVSQQERSRARFAKGNYPAPKPGPGVFATSDSVATPALLPDGTPASKSISPIVEPHELDAATIASKG